MSFWRLYYHLVWTTQDRAPLIQPEIEGRLYPYMVNKAVELGVYAINGWYDHVHLIVAISPKHAVAHVVKMLKGVSSHDLNQAAGLDQYFAWQRGYGALSIGERQRAVAQAYVADQKQHHQHQTTNAWLERSDEFDEGPADPGTTPRIVPAVHERSPAYNLLGEPPF